MKTRLLTILTAMLVQQALCQQNDSLENRFLLNFVVPDMPAYKAFDVDPSNLLRPSDIKEFAVMLNPFYSNGKAVIPKNFALEFAPWKIASKAWTLSQYNAKGSKRFLYNSSFSIGAISDSSEYAAKLSIGYRFSVLSKKADLIRIVYDSRSAFKEKTLKATEIKKKLQNYWIETIVPKVPNEERSTYIDNHLSEFYSFLSTLEKIEAPSDRLKSLIYDTKQVFGDDFDFTRFRELTFEDVQSALTEQLITTYRNENWNANRFDGAIAFVSESKDSLLTNARFSSFNAWATFGARTGKSSQLLIGGRAKFLNAGVGKSQNRPLDLSGSIRFLIGNSNFRFFGETQWAYVNYGQIKNSVLLNLGGELRLSNKFWIVASSGINNLRERAVSGWYNQFVANLDLRYGFSF